MATIWSELKRRHVLRVAIAYLAAAWLILQVADVVLGNVSAPGWVIQLIMVLLAIGLPIAMLFAWAFEITDAGIERDTGSVSSSPATLLVRQRLNRVTIAILATAVVFLLADRFFIGGQPEFAESAAVTDQSVAVLPFVAMSDGPDDGFFADGLTEEILNALAQLPELLVTARTSSFSFKGQNIPVTEIANTLGVAHIVEGSVRRADGQIRVTAQLIRAEDGFHLWSDTFDRPDTEVFTTQTEISEKIALALGVILNDESRQRMQAIGIRNPEAFVALQKGQVLSIRAHGDSQGTIALLGEAIIYFEKVIQLEPNYAGAYRALGDYYDHLLKGFSDTPEFERAGGYQAVFDRLQWSLENVARLAGDSATAIDAQIGLAMLYRRWDRLPDLYRAGTEAAECSSAVTWMYLVGAVNNDWALRVSERLLRCNPMEYFVYVTAAQAFINVDDGKRASEIAARGMEVAPHPQIVGKLVLAQLAVSDIDAAQSAVNRYIDDEYSRTVYEIWIAAALGNRDDANTAYDTYIEEYSDSRNVLHISHLAVLGRRDDANILAAKVDSLSGSEEQLLWNAITCSCGAPFDLEYTPNFARFVEEAGINWPTPRSVEWPLKDW